MPFQVQYASTGQFLEKAVHCACKLQCFPFLDLELMTGMTREKTKAGQFYEAQTKAL